MRNEERKTLSAAWIRFVEALLLLPLLPAVIVAPLKKQKASGKELTRLCQIGKDHSDCSKAL